MAQTPVSQTNKCSEFLKCYLVGAAKAEPIENWYENVCRDEQAQEVGAAQEPVLRAMCVNLRWSTQNGHRWLKGGQQRKGHRKAAHAAVGQQELLCGPLATPWEGIVKADSSGGHQQHGKNHIIHCAEVHLNNVPHDAVRYGEEHTERCGPWVISEGSVDS